MIIGAQKAGTSSLNMYLAQHPEIATHFTQEFGMFADEESYNRGLPYYYNHTVSEDVKKDNSKTIFIAKRAGLLYRPDMLQKLKEHNPDIKILVILRNPVDRAFSAFWYCRQTGMEPYADFNEAVYTNDISRFKGNIKLQRNCDYEGRSDYAKHLKNVYAIFDKQNVYVALFEEIMQNLNSYLNSVCRLLGLNEAYNFNTNIRYNETSSSKSVFLANRAAPGKNKLLKKFLPFGMRTFLKQSVKKMNTAKVNNEANKREMSTDTRQYLKNIFQPQVAELKQLTNLPLEKYWQEFF